MKKYLISIDYKFWTQGKASSRSTVTVLLLFLALFSTHSAKAANPKVTNAKIIDENRFNQNERIIINSVVNQFKRECGHRSVLDESKLGEIQSFFQSNKDTMIDVVSDCYAEHLSQLVATHTMHHQTCEEVTPKENLGEDKDLARIFINVRRYQTGIWVYHVKLNECLVRSGADRKQIIPFSDFEKNGRLLSKKIREINMEMPFKENSVKFR